LVLIDQPLTFSPCEVSYSKHDTENLLEASKKGVTPLPFLLYCTVSVILGISFVRSPKVPSVYTFVLSAQIGNPRSCNYLVSLFMCALLHLGCGWVGIFLTQSQNTSLL
jgi:hypothetical protein